MIKTIHSRTHSPFPPLPRPPRSQVSMATAQGALPGVRHLSLPAEAPGEAGEGEGGSHRQTPGKNDSARKVAFVLQWGRP